MYVYDNRISLFCQSVSTDVNIHIYIRHTFNSYTYHHTNIPPYHHITMPSERPSPTGASPWSQCRTRRQETTHSPGGSGASPSRQGRCTARAPRSRRSSRGAPPPWWTPCCRAATAPSWRMDRCNAFLWLVAFVACVFFCL
jgi:hypothetical protein